MTPRRSRLHQRLARAVGRAVADFRMIGQGDRILCAVSGGKDSFALHELLVEAERRAPVHFEVIPVHVDQGHPDFPRGSVERSLRARGYACHTVVDDTYTIVRDKVPDGQTPCALCSRLRRAILYRAATELGCNKVALGHHRDDIIATLLLNLLFVGQLKAMPPVLVNDAGSHVVIRPLCYCAEEDIAQFAKERQYEVVPCGFCSEKPTERGNMSDLLSDLERRYPGVKATMMTALGDVRASHLLDAGLWQALDLPVAQRNPSRG